MDKGSEFARTVKLDWLDVCATLCIQNIEPKMMRQQLAALISETVQGKESQRKTIDVMMAIWVKTERTAPRIRQEALAIFPTLSSAEERLWLHYGMTLACYPIFRKVVSAVGQVSRTEAIITRNLIKARIAADYGHLGALDRSVERILASITNWGTLTNTEQKQNYRIVLHRFAAPENLQGWLLSSALYAHPSEAIPFNDLVHLPELYPFKFTIGVDNLRRDTRFEVQRQGGGLDMVKLQTE